MQCSSRKVWERVYALAVFHILLANCFVYSCELPPDWSQCYRDVAPTNKTNIVDLNSSGCNGTHIWTSWRWSTPTGCAIEKVVIRVYTCYLKDSQQLTEVDRVSIWPESDARWSRSYPNTWNISLTPLECNINGYFVTEESCEQKLLPVNITCSNPVQYTLTSSLPMSSSSVILTTAATHNQKTSAYIQSMSMLNSLTIQPTPIITPEHKISSHTPPEIQIVVIMIAFTVVLLLITSIVVVILKRWKNQKLTNYANYYKNQTEDFKPDFAPVIPDQVIFKDEILSIKSIVSPLEKIECILTSTDATTATQKLSQPNYKDYREMG